MRKFVGVMSLVAVACAGALVHARQADVTATLPAAMQLHPSKVLVVVEENKSFSKAWSGMPYLRSLARQYGYSGTFRAVGSPSEPNYLAIAGGSTFGVTSDASPAVNAAKVGKARTVFGQALAKGRTAKIYNQSASSYCDKTASGTYAVKHNPWPYFKSESSKCSSHDVPMGSSFTSAAQSNSLPNVGMLVPNLCNDAHDCSLTVADNWLKSTLPAALNSNDFATGKLAVVVVFDGSDGGHTSAPVLCVVADANLHGKVVTASLNHFGLSKSLSKTVGATPMRKAAKAKNVLHAFGL